MITKWLTINEYSRPGTKLKAIKGVVIHWVGNPNTDAMFNWQYFENRKYTQTGYGSAHYIIDMDGSVIECIPRNEMAYHVGAKKYTPYAKKYFSDYPNNCTIGIEVCHPDWSGSPTEQTFDAAVMLTAGICRENYLNPIDHVCLHFDITRKDCHKWFVDNPGEWFRFKGAVDCQLL